MNCKIAIFKKFGEPLEITTVHIPPLKEGEVLVKILYTTLCRSDITTYTGKRIEKAPTILGHEIVGRVVSVCSKTPLKDENGEALHEGDPITWAIYASNPHDPMSERGIPQKAADLFKYGHQLLTPESTLHGGLAEYIILRRHTPIMKLHRTPLDIAPIINCAIATTAGALRLAGDVRGRSVSIFGAGMLGVIACAMCHAHGASRVLAVDLNEERLKEAVSFGATETMTFADLQQTEDVFADVTMDFSGADSCMQMGLERLNIGGVTVWVGGVFPQKPLPVNAERVIRNLYTIKGLHNYNAEDFKNAVNFIEQHCDDYPFEQLIQGHFALNDADKAFKYALEENPYRVRIKL